MFAAGFIVALLSMQNDDIGAASAAMNFGFTVLGSVGMMTGSLEWGGHIDGLAYTMLIFLAASVLILVFARRAKIVV